MPWPAVKLVRPASYGPGVAPACTRLELRLSSLGICLMVRVPRLGFAEGRDGTGLGDRSAGP